MSWGIEDRVAFRAFIGTQAGNNLINLIRVARPNPIPKDQGDPVGLSEKTVLTVAAYAYKSQGWIDCENFLLSLCEDEPATDLHQEDKFN
jgi:hypothetical protein